MSGTAKREAEAAFGGEADSSRVSSPNKKARHDNKRTSPSQQNDARRDEPVVTEATEPVKKKSRSRRNKKPKFDQNNSHIELVLAKAKEREEEEAEPESKPTNEKRKSKHSEKPRSEGRTRTDAILQKHNEHKHGASLDDRERHAHVKSHHSKTTRTQWTLSEPSGGAFIDHDPVLTPDEQSLILATKKDVQVYATKTSLLVRTMHVTTTSEILTYALTPMQEQFIVVGLRDGSLVKLNWTTGQRLWSTTLTNSITSVVSTSSTSASDGLLIVNDVDDGTSHVSSLALDEKGRQLGRRTMLQQKKFLQRVSFSAELGVAVICSKDTIFIGKLGDSDGEQETPLQWHEVSVLGKIVCFDALILPALHQSGKISNHPLVRVAVGLKSGEIHLYNDVLNRTSTRANDLSIRRLHWHRAAPRTVKFSPDSNYLISGGDETVLVIWQLDTNQKQMLPHLTTPIMNATVSYRGSAYALRLGDNSVMVLSTSDLQPFANVSSLAFDVSCSALFLPGIATPAVLHPSHPDRLLVAYSVQSLVPSIKPSEKTTNMLQTYDLASRLQLNRQALARNLVATVNIGPKGQPLKEPDVTHLEITHDGKWLITVDQWSPSDADLNEMYLSRGDQSSREQCNECFLRFWSTNAGLNSGAIDMWELNTRIDEPVTGGQSMNSLKVLDVGVSLTRHQVAVADSSRHLKIYSPKARVRNGVSVKDADGQQLFTWTCDHEISLQEARAAAPPRSATISFSEDGSVLAVSWASTSSARSRVHLIEPKSGKVAASLPEIVTSSKSHLAFCGRFLLALSDKFCIYDTVAMQQTFAIDIDKKFDHGKARMAVNPRSGIVAVSVSERDVKQPSRLLLLNVYAPERRPLLEERIYSQAHILLAERDAGGFLIVDGEGRTIKVSTPASVSTDLTAIRRVQKRTEIRSALDHVFGAGRQSAAASAEEEAEVPQRSALENVFKFESSAQAPAASDLFSQVAMIVSGAAA